MIRWTTKTRDVTRRVDANGLTEGDDKRHSLPNWPTAILGGSMIYPTATLDNERELANLADYAGMDLRFECDPDAPLLWAVWGAERGEVNEDIVGAGNTPIEAIDDARKTIRGWIANRDEKNSDAWTAHNREPSR